MSEVMLNEIGLPLYAVKENIRLYDLRVVHNDCSTRLEMTPQDRSLTIDSRVVLFDYGRWSNTERVYRVCSPNGRYEGWVLINDIQVTQVLVKDTSDAHPCPTNHQPPLDPNEFTTDRNVGTSLASQVERAIASLPEGSHSFTVDTVTIEIDSSSSEVPYSVLRDSELLGSTCMLYGAILRAAHASELGESEYLSRLLKAVNDAA